MSLAIFFPQRVWLRSLRAGFRGSIEAFAGGINGGVQDRVERAVKIKELEFTMNKRLLMHRLTK